MIWVDNVGFKQDSELIRLNKFATILIQQLVGVMNIIPISEPDTLPIIYDWGLIGMYHDRCEPHNIYPCTYDLLHANHIIISITNKYFILLHIFSNTLGTKLVIAYLFVIPKLVNTSTKGQSNS
jgi:hypothetical protein